MTEVRRVIALAVSEEADCEMCRVSGKLPCKRCFIETDAILTALREAGFAVVPVYATTTVSAEDTWNAMLKASQGGTEP